MVSIPIILFTPEQYLAIEREAEFKSELVMGEMLGMAGASYNHGVIIQNLSLRLGNLLENKPCQIITNEIKVNVGTEFFYPDMAVHCGSPQFLDNRQDVLLNPVLLIEVLSKSTEGYDLNYKLSEYTKIPTLRELVYISQIPVRIHHYERLPNEDWRYSTIDDPTGILPLESIGCSIPVSLMYAKISQGNT
jgi:Uma2 family endonuclease